MPDKPQSYAPLDQDVLRHHKPKHLKLLGWVGLGVLASVAVIGLVTRVFASRETQDWTKDQATPTVELVTLKPATASGFTLPETLRPSPTPRYTRRLRGTCKSGW